MNAEWNYQSIESVLASNFRETSVRFDEKAARMFEAFEDTTEQQNKVIRFPTGITAFGAIAAVVVLSLVSINLFQKPQNSVEVIEFERLIAMDETLQDGAGILDMENFEALQSISWMIENS